MYVCVCVCVCVCVPCVHNCDVVHDMKNFKRHVSSVYSDFGHFRMQFVLVIFRKERLRTTRQRIDDRKEQSEQVEAVSFWKGSSE
jgi:hypothetical protein